MYVYVCVLKYHIVLIYMSKSLDHPYTTPVHGYNIQDDCDENLIENKKIVILSAYTVHCTSYSVRIRTLYVLVNACISI